ncbi:ATP-dependent nuclease [Sporolactobacillus laevolacticus]|uniref:Uncharacterized protein n=1 Tax=Sporolactobacillus laevolacticus DSM 442 TaxID=1395513 RepID=V6IUR7_9BACL|nr:AAA family ATPase [Sporolactobacillus laevolacticus]EST10903.1 hypothetical protein P343_15130 [Sporolactobacillus laevolacticus DSM 442]
MYLKRIKINNFRKFGLGNNEVELVDAQSYLKRKEAKDVNIASTTTLIVGKNNVGKTTIIQAMNKLIHGENINSNDFNFFYLKKLFSEYKIDNYKNIPIIEFIVTIGLDKGRDDYVTNIIPFMLLKDIDATEMNIIVRYELTDTELFISAVKKIITKKYNESVKFSRILDVIDDSHYTVNYYDKNMKKVEKFHLKDLIDLAMVKANNVTGDKCLSDAFNKIIQYRYEELFKDEKEALEDKLAKINNSLTKDIERKHTKPINSSLKRVVSGDILHVLLSADLTFQKLIRNMVKYEYIEKGNHIPENQFGLGYTNLMMIIADLIDYMEKYPDSAFNSRINLICIEEPETYMHPQMQELFIKYINDAIATLLSFRNKNINSQLIITTHSSHILNSKVHIGESFNNINYVTAKDNFTKVIPLNDILISPSGTTNDKDFKFIKKHIKFNFSDLFFADAAILVEGISEYNLLPFYLNQDRNLKHKYITILNINGAHGLVYTNLIKALKIPTLIITDLDIKRDDAEKENFKQISSLKGRTTTNQTIKAFNSGMDNIEDLANYLQDENIYVLFQRKTGYYFPTSFEEAFIAKNFDNAILNEVLKRIKPGIYNEILGNSVNYQYNKKYSYKWQSKLSNDKSRFSNEILYEMMTQEDNIPTLPNYIEKGLKFLSLELGSR